MSQFGLRLLSLDGGGTRGLSTIYILRELMSQVSYGDGDNVRPCHYFDLIAGTGLNGLSALLFVRFSYTIKEALKFWHNLSKSLDEVEELRDKILHGTVEQNAKSKGWAECMKEFQEPQEQLEALRQKIVQDCWFEVINTNVVDVLEKYKYKVDGAFNYMAVGAELEAGRTKAFVVSSESKGQGADGGISDDRQYHVPILHRTYFGRHENSAYTLYAMGLGTVASPNIIKPGVVFPIFEATGKHSAHNPVELVLEESRRLWPGFQISLLISIGTGAFDMTKHPLSPLIEDTGKACTEISKKNQKIAGKFEEFVVPFDISFEKSYFRFDNLDSDTFFEYAEKDRIEEAIRVWMETPEQIVRCDSTVEVLSQKRLLKQPDTLVVLSALASLLSSLSVAGHSYESLLISDVIATYIIYDPPMGLEASIRTYISANITEKLSKSVLSRLDTYANVDELTTELGPERNLMEMIALLEDELCEEEPPPRELRTVFDVAPSLYRWLILGRESKMSELDDQQFARQFEHFWAHSEELPPTYGVTFQDTVDCLIRLAATAALCSAATTQLLRCVKSLAYNSDLVQHLRYVLLGISASGISSMIVDPIATMISLLLENGHWSFSNDDIIFTLLKVKIYEGDAWSQVNLALKRSQIKIDPSPGPAHNEIDVVSACLEFLAGHADTWKAHVQDLVLPCVTNGWFALLRKVLWAEELTSVNRGQRGPQFVEQTATAIRLTAQAGHLYTLRCLVESLGIEYQKIMVNLPDTAGLTAVHLACKYRAPEEIFLLFAILDADINKVCNLGRTPLSYCFPARAKLSGVYQDVRDLIREGNFPSTVPLDMPQVWTSSGTKTVDPRAHGFRRLIAQLINAKADITIVDNEGMTPLHHAAKEGWKDNLDLFFTTKSQELEDCLILRDSHGHTVLDYSRMFSNETETDGGEDIIVAQMEKLDMSVPPKSQLE